MSDKRSACSSFGENFILQLEKLKNDCHPIELLPAWMITKLHPMNRSK
jgi:hypothetical protein